MCYYVFEDRRTVSFISNVFPESMETSVVHMHLDGTLQFQSIPPLLPAYNRYMGSVGRLNQLRKTYCFIGTLVDTGDMPFLSFLL